MLAAILIGLAGMAAGVSVPNPPEAGKAQIVFFRKGGWMGAALSCAIYENGEKLTSLPPGRYAVVVVEPGAHEFAIGRTTKDALHLEMEPNETYYANCNIGIGPQLAPSDRISFNTMFSRLKAVKRNDADEGGN